MKHQIDSFPGKSNSFFLKERLLLLIVAVKFGKRDHSLGVDDAMPGDPDAMRKIVKRVSNQPGMTGEPTNSCDSPVSRNLTLRNLPHGIPDLSIKLRGLLLHSRIRSQFNRVCKLREFFRRGLLDIGMQTVAV